MERFAGRKLVRSWLFQDIGWFALTEGAARFAVELAFVLALLLLHIGFAWIVVAWLLLHTFLWLAVYGGYMRIWVVSEHTTDLSRLQAYLARVSDRIHRETSFERAVLRGSAARGELTEHSDIDFLIVPRGGLRTRTRALLVVWSLRGRSVLERVPLQLRWVDTERCLPFLLIKATSVELISSPGDGSISRARGRRSPGPLLITFSGMDGSGKTTAAQRLVSTLQTRGYRASYFYGHRQAWYVPPTGRPQLSFSIIVESIWKRLGRGLDEFARFPLAKFAYDAATAVDYLYVRWKLSGLLDSNEIVVSDRSVADVIAYLRAFGPVYGSLEGLLTAIAPEADVAFLFRITPELALTRKQEHPIERLRLFAADYDDLAPLLGLIPIDASEAPEVVQGRVETVLEPSLRRPGPEASPAQP